MDERNSLKIAWLLPTAWFYWQPTLSELTKKFPQTKVFTGLFPGFAKGFENALDVEVIGGRKVIAVTESSTSYGDNFTYLSPQIVPRILQYDPDIVFTSSFGIWSIIALLLKLFKRWKVVIAYEGSSPGVDYTNSSLRIALRKMMIWLSDGCITNSYGGKKYLVEVLNSSEQDVFVHPYEVPDVRSLAEIDDNLQYLSSDSTVKFDDLQHPVFLFVGSIVPRKGVRCLIEACKSLKQSTTLPFNVLLVGDGLQSSELKALSDLYDLEDCIKWVGHIEYDNISTYFARADVFVLPTLEDTWGMVVLEAMLLCKPVICSMGAGASELIVEAKNGYCFKPNNSEELASAMEKFVKQPEKILAMGEFSKQIMNQYTPQAAADVMAKVVSHVALI